MTTIAMEATTVKEAICVGRRVTLRTLPSHHRILGLTELSRGERDESDAKVVVAFDATSTDAIDGRLAGSDLARYRGIGLPCRVEGVYGFGGRHGGAFSHT